jgi:hypothetical protein
MKEYIKLRSRRSIVGNDIVHSASFYKDSEYEIYHRANNKPAKISNMVYSKGLFEYWKNGRFVTIRINQ